MRTRVLLIWLVAMAFLSVGSPAWADDTVTVYRMYNTKTSEHLYTTSLGEYNACGSGNYSDWRAEGVAWESPASSAIPVYRLYNPKLGDHHYTSNDAERKALVENHGWKSEVVAFYSVDGEEPYALPLHRLYNGKLKRGQHHYTASSNERDVLTSNYGWRYEDVGFFGIDPDYEEKGDARDGDSLDLGGLQDLMTEGDVEVVFQDDGVSPRSIIGQFTNGKVYDTDDAAQVLNWAAPLFGDDFYADASEIIVNSASDAEDTENFFRYSPTYNGLPVLGSQIVIATDDDGNVTGLNSTYDNEINYVNTDPYIDEEEAANIVKSQIAEELGVGVDEFELSVDTLLAIDAIDDDTSPLLVWRVIVNNHGEAEDEEIVAEGEDDTVFEVEAADDVYGPVQDDSSEALAIDRTYYIAANDQVLSTGEILRMHDNVCGATTSTGWTNVYLQCQFPNGTTRLLSAQKNSDGTYRLYDASRNIQVYQATYSGWWLWRRLDLPGETVTFGSTVDAASAIAHYNMEQTYDYYNAVLGRDSFDDNHAKIKVTCNVENSQNAAWNSGYNQFFIGDTGNLGAGLDVLGHEFTHAVITYVVGNGNGLGLIYANESGALNESYADIMGCLVEGKSGSGKWLMGEDTDEAIRSMSDPSVFHDPKHYRERYIPTNPNDRNEQSHLVHTNSSIFNHAAYLMMVDSRTNGISAQTWAKVFYRSLFRLSNDSNFRDAREAVIAAAYRAAFSESQINAIKKAFDDVGITSPDNIRIVLRWSYTPDDLDSHFYGPITADEESSGRFHTWYSDKTYTYGDKTLVDLDYDVTTSYGPEITTLHELVPGTYYFAVHDYTNRNSSSTTEMARSHATVQIYRRDELLKTFSVRASSSGNWWDVCQLDISEDGDLTITALNRYGYDSDLS